MSFWSSTLTGVVVEAAVPSLIGVGNIVYTDHRQTKCEKSAEERRAKAEWDAWQVEVLADLQEQLELVGALVGQARTDRETERTLVLAPARGRAMMLWSRLGNTELGAEVRKWLVDTRLKVEAQPDATDGFWQCAADRRAELQDKLSLELMNHHRGKP